MSDFVTRGFRAQLNAAMESLLTRAVFDIMMIFESSLHNHQLEMARRGEEVAQLKIKLQTAELKLVENTGGGTETDVTQKEPDVVMTSEDEFSAEEPDDWCAPLGEEAMFRLDEGVCPSVKLRKLCIPLCRVPLNKQKETSHLTDSHHRRKFPRRSSRVSSSNKSHSHTPETGDNQREPRVSQRCSMRRFSPNIKEESIEQPVDPSLRRRKRGRPSGQIKKNTMIKHEPKEQESEEDVAKTFRCRFCKMEFNTEFGRKVHIRSHKTCRGCKQYFAFPSELKVHWKRCTKYQSLLAKEMKNTFTPQPQPWEGEGLTRSGRKLGTAMEGNSTPYFCSTCTQNFKSKLQLTEHNRMHTGMSVETNLNLKWSSPLKDPEGLIPPTMDTNHTISRKDTEEMENPGHSCEDS